MEETAATHLQRSTTVQNQSYRTILAAKSFNLCQLLK